MARNLLIYVNVSSSAANRYSPGVASVGGITTDQSNEPYSSHCVVVLILYWLLKINIDCG